MPKLRRLSGRDVIKILSKYDFQEVSQRGSHVKLKRIIEDRKQVLTIPDHKELDTGTVRAIFMQASGYIDAEELRPYFYSE